MAQPVQIISRLSEAYGYMMLSTGLFHADAHPGNIMVLPKGVVGLIDYGQSKQLSDEERLLFARLVVSLAECGPPPPPGCIFHSNCCSSSTLLLPPVGDASVHGRNDPSNRQGTSTAKLVLLLQSRAWLSVCAS